MDHAVRVLGENTVETPCNIEICVQYPVSALELKNLINLFQLSAIAV